MRRFLTVLAICLLPLAGFLAFSPDVGGMLALGQDPELGMNVAYRDAADEYLDTAGVSYTTQGTSWTALEYHEDQYANWPDSSVQRANNHGIKVNFQITRSPVGKTAEDSTILQWALRDDNQELTDCAKEERADDDPDDEIGFVSDGSNGIAQCPPDPSNLDDFADLVYEILDRYDGSSGHGQIHSISITNEANAPAFFYEEDLDPGDTYAGDGADDVTIYDMYSVADSVIDNYFPSIDLAGPEGAGCSFPEDDPEGGSNWDFFVLEEFRNQGITLDILATHCYAGWAYDDSASAASYTYEYVDSADAHNWTGPIWLSEYGKAGKLSEQEIREFLEVKDYADPDFDRFFYYHWTVTDSSADEPDKDRDIVEVGPPPDFSFHDLKGQPYCYLVYGSGNKDAEGFCIDATINGSTTVPPNTECTWTASPTDPSYSYIWYRNGFQVDTGQSYSYLTPSSGSFTLAVKTTGPDTYGEAGIEVTVSSTGMCPN